MKIQQLKDSILSNKKRDKERSKALSSVLKHVESKTVGVIWKSEDEEKIVLQSFKKELKEQLQSKECGAPYSKTTINVCEHAIKEQSPEVLSVDEIKNAISDITSRNPNAKMGEIMGKLKKQFADSIDMGMAQKEVKSYLTDK